MSVDLFKIPEGYLAQCPNHPEILVTGKTKSEIKDNLKRLLNGYVEAFPETKHKFFPKNDQMVKFKFEK